MNTGPDGQVKEGGLLLGNSSLVTNGLIVRYGNVGIGTTNPGAKLHIGGVAGTDGIMFPDGKVQVTAGGARYKVKYDQTDNLYTIGSFTSPEAIFSLPSQGAVIFPYQERFLGSFLLEMKVYATEAITKTLHLGASDNRVDFFMDGAHVAGPWLVGTFRTNVSFYLTPGDHTIQIIFNAQGVYDYLFLYGDIVDNEKVFYKG